MSEPVYHLPSFLLTHTEMLGRAFDAGELRRTAINEFFVEADIKRAQFTSALDTIHIDRQTILAMNTRQS